MAAAGLWCLSPTRVIKSNSDWTSNFVRVEVLVSPNVDTVAKLQDTVINTILDTNKNGPLFRVSSSSFEDKTMMIKNLHVDFSTDVHLMDLTPAAKVRGDASYEPGFVCKGTSTSVNAMDGCGVSASTSEYAFGKQGAFAPSIAPRAIDAKNVLHQEGFGFNNMPWYPKDQGGRNPVRMWAQ